MASASILLPGGAAAQQQPSSPIHFSPRPIAFSLDSSETPQRHAPETMAGGVAVFDYDRDGKPDIFFTNGADINTLKKNSPKYWNRLFHNNGDGTFTDVTEKAGLKGTGFDVGVAIGDYDNDGYEDIFVAGVYRNTLYHNNGDGTFTDVTEEGRPGQISTSNTGLSGPWRPLGWTSTTTGCSICSSSTICPGTAARSRTANSTDKPEYCHPKFYKETAEPTLPEQGRRHIHRYLGASRHSRPSGQRHVGVALPITTTTACPIFLSPTTSSSISSFTTKATTASKRLAFETGRGPARARQPHLRDGRAISAI